MDELKQMRVFERVRRGLDSFLTAVRDPGPIDASAENERLDESQSSDPAGDVVDVVSGRPTVAASAGRMEESVFAGSMTALVARSRADKYRNPMRTLDLILDYNPDAALAVWNFLRMVNPGHTVTAFDNENRAEVDAEGTAMLAARTDSLSGAYGRDYGGGLDNLINLLTLTLASNGAIAGELELDETLIDVLDWSPVSPRVVTFLRHAETKHYDPAISMNGKYYLLPKDQFRYVPLDPRIGDPYGRCPLLPTLEATFFQVEMLRDLKMVAHTTGHPRVHFKVLKDIVLENAPERYMNPGKEEELQEWVDGYLTALADAYNELKPDDAFFTWDSVEVAPLNAGKASFDLASLVKVVEHQVFAALKQLPIMMGRVEGTGLAHGSVQWQIYAETIEALQKVVGTLASWWATQTLRVWGRPSFAVIEFEGIRKADRLKEAQAHLIETTTVLQHFKLGLISHPEMAMKLVGHEPAVKGIETVESVNLTPGSGKGKTGKGVEEEEEEPPEEEAGEGEGEAEEGKDGEKPSKLDEAVIAAILEDGGVDPDLVDIVVKNNGAGGTYRAHDVGVVGSEHDYFIRLPAWMKARVRETKDSVVAFADVRRERIVDDLESIEE